MCEFFDNFLSIFKELNLGDVFNDGKLENIRFEIGKE